MTDTERREFIKALLASGLSATALSALLPLAGCASVPQSNAKPERQPSQEKRPQPADAICIVGAGASGIAAAHYLSERGYTNVVVYEERDRIGGKCKTVQIDGLPYDMGAVF